MWNTRLRTVLRLNATTSGLGGLVALAAAPWVSETLGIDHVALTAVIGAGLIVFAAAVVWISTQSDDRLVTGAAAVSAADAGWVVATVAVLAFGWLTTAGVVVAVALGVVVADFALAQLWFRSAATS